MISAWQVGYLFLFQIEGAQEEIFAYPDTLLRKYDFGVKQFGLYYPAMEVISRID